MEPEKFMTLAEFNALLKAAKDDRERCILLLLAGAGLRVGEMTQIRAEEDEGTRRTSRGRTRVPKRPIKPFLV
jgi:integrase